MTRAKTKAAPKGHPPTAAPTPDLTVEWLPVGRLKPDPKNPRKITADAAARLKRGIERFGMPVPILVRAEDDVVIGGHQRLQAAKALGWDTVPVIRRAGLTVADARALNVLLNNPGAQGEWDEDQLAEYLRTIEADDYDLTLTGFDDAELADLLKSPQGGGGIEDEDTFDPEPPKRPKSKLGQTYELGPHRLVCGDSAATDTWARLLPGGARASCLWTDPPYGVSYGEKNARLNRGDKKRGSSAPWAQKSRIEDPIANDSLNAGELRSLMERVFAAAQAHCEPGAAWYLAVPAGPLNLVFAGLLVEMGVLRQGLVWRKNNHVLGGNDYHYIHEPILYGWTPGAGHRWHGDRSQVSVLDVDRPMKNDLHPTMKPVELVRQCITNSSAQGEIVVDPFGGSGTTLVACESMQRKARLIEIEPGYCDVIRRRYADLVNDPSLAP